MPNGDTYFFYDISNSFTWFMRQKNKDDVVLWVYSQDTSRYILAKEDVVAVVSQGDFGAAQFFGGAVEDTAAQAAAQRTSRFAFVQHAFDGGVGVFFNDFVQYAYAFKIGRQNFFGEARLLLIEIDGNQLEINRCTGLELAQDV